MKIFNKISKIWLITFFALFSIGLGFFAVQLVNAAWTGPTANPPNNNPSFWTNTVSPPTVFYGVAGGKVGIGTSNPGPTLVDKSLDVVGDVAAARVCIAGDCRNAWPATSGITNAFNKVADIANTTQFNAVGGDRIQFGAGSGLGISFLAGSNRVTYNLIDCPTNGQVLKDNGASSWICASDSGGNIGTGLFTGQTLWWDNTAPGSWNAGSNLLVNSNSTGAPGGFDGNYRLTVGNSAAGSTLGAIKAEVNGTTSPALYLNNAASGGLSFDTGSFQLRGVAAGSLGAPGIGNGRMYYDSTSNRFKCWEGNPLTLKDCITPTGGAPTIVDNPNGTANTDIARIKLTADTFYRFAAGLNSTSLPQILFGSGTAAGDLRLYRSGANTLVIDNGAGGSSNLNLIGGSYQLGGQVGVSTSPDCAAGQFLTGAVRGGILTSASCSTPAGSTVFQVSNDPGVANSYVARMKLDVVDTTGYRVTLGINSANQGFLRFGAGGASVSDTHLYRIGVGQARLDDYLSVGAATVDTNFRITTSGGGIKSENNSSTQPAEYVNNAAVNSIALDTGPVNVRGVTTVNAPSAPAVGNGRIFYDSSLAKFRCWEAGVLVNCIADSSGAVTGSGSAGQAAFWTGTSSLSGDNGFFWDNSLKRLGIGATGPAQKLEVVGNAQLTGVNPHLRFYDTDGALNYKYAGIYWYEGGFLFRGFNDAGTVRKELMTISAEGAVGIVGNATVADRLYINGVTNGWGNTVINGRVWSSNSNIHLSPPGGFNVVVNGDYREAGGVAGGVKMDVWSAAGAGGYISSGNYGGTGTAAYFPSGLWSNGASAWIYGNLYTGNIMQMNGFAPANGVIRLTPNLHLNSNAGNAVIVNWDNGTVGTSNTLRVGNGAGADVFTVRADGAQTFDFTNVIRDGGGGWIRTYGSTGWYSQTFGGGWYMIDTTWIRSYGGKDIYIGAAIFATGAGGRIGIGDTSPAYPLRVNDTVSVSISGYARTYNGSGCGLTNCTNHASSDGSATFSISGSFAGYIQMTSGAIYSSDQRLKNFVGDIDPSMALDSVNRLRPLMFTWKDEAGKGSGQHAGLFAQEVIDAVPESVYQLADVLPDQLHLDYNALTTFGLAAIRGLNEKVDLLHSEQQKQIDVLKAEINALKVEVDALKARQ